ncbi:MAG TPA: putative toxin-antitoxin system toxin component, PIN family [Opitutaceae bacterium]|nr:putative toxin-antitoxin system toxin component, PIN family [Opitutaceae bacterium]
MRLVLDTNVLLAAVFADGLCRDLVRKRVTSHELCASPELLAELAAKLRDKFGVDPAEVPLYGAYRERVKLVHSPRLAKPVCRDPDDDQVLAAAMAAEAEIIVTGDQDLLVLKQHAGIRILSPRQFLELLDKL